jgi:hypothetical protein
MNAEAFAKYFSPALAPPDVAPRVQRALEEEPERLAELADCLRVDAAERGVALIRPGRGGNAPSARARRVAERARRELRVFASVADAESVGYRPCRVCRPPFDPCRAATTPNRDECLT